MRKGQKIKLLTNVGKLKKNEIVTVTGVDYALRMAFIKNDKGISESVDNNFSNYQLMNDSKELKFKEGSLKVGQTFKTGNEKGKILKLQWDPRFGYDVLYYSEKSGQNVWTQAESNFTLDSNDNLLSEKQLLELAKKHNWNEDKMLNELRKLNLGVSNSDLQAIVEGFLLLNASDSNERLKSYNIKNHNSGKRYRVRAKSYQDAKDKYEKFIAKNPVNDAVQWDTFLANLGFMHYGGHGKIQKWKYRGDNYNDFEKAINHIRRIDRNLILSSSHINSNEYIITIEKPITDSFSEDSINFVEDVYIPDIEKYLESKFDKNEKNLDKIFKELKSKFPNADKDEIDYVVSGYLNDWNDNQYDRLLSKYFKDANSIQIPKSSKEFERVISEYYKKYGKILQVESMVYNFETGKYYMYNESTDYSFTSKRLSDSITEDAVVNYIETYKGVKIYQREDNKKYTATVYAKSFEEKDLKTLKTKIDKAQNEHSRKYRNLDSLTEDATIAQLEIKNQFLNENDDADDIIYLGFNDDRKISFYEYNNEYYAFFDLENRVEKIDKEKVQRILKKNIIETSEEDNKDEPFREPGDEGIAATVRAEDDESIPLSQFNPERLVKAVETRKMALHNYVKLNDNETYFIAVYRDFISVVRIDKDNNQKRVVDKSFKDLNEAVKILKEVESKLKRGGYR